MSALSQWQAVQRGSDADGPGINPAVHAPGALALEEDKLPFAAELRYKEHGSNPREQGQETVATGPVSSHPVPPPPEDITSSLSKQIPPPQEAAILPRSTHGVSGAFTRQNSVLIVDDNAINLRVRRKRPPILVSYLTRLHRC